ncbi:hypothetical protein OTU49_010447 [Cherax quadricarinatus]|uniref:RGS domain-containing protein n=1 Tax=Cherax quadricarinatus TaxID=27406 RepID=A0AAW0WFE9_CHEQU|nr:A-kinase anchor protein 10, mitochondrial-like [Cherax quadricarinatus]
MASLWRKLRGGGSGGGSPNHVSYARRGLPPQAGQQGAQYASQDAGAPVMNSTQIIRTAPYTITQADEQCFMCDVAQERVDPLVVESQFVKTIDDILNSPSTLPYFMQFLQGWGADKYARFWLDTNNFRAAAITRISSQDFQNTCDKPTSMVGNVADKFNEKNCNKTPDRDEGIYCESNSQVYNTQSPGKVSLGCLKDNRHCQNKNLILPDLVSGIKNASDVTPLNTPDGSSSNVLTCQARTSHQEPVSVRKKEKAYIQKKNIETECSKSVLQDSSVEERSNSRPSASVSHQAHKLRQSIADDAMRIFNKYLAKEAECSVGVSDAIVYNIFKAISVVQEDIDADCFVPAQKIVITALQQEFLPKFLASDYYLKHQIDVLTSGSVRLADILYSDSAFPYFMEYVEQEGGRNMLQLWVAVSNFRQQLVEQGDTYDPKQAQADAMILYDKYFSLQAMCPLGFSDSVRFIVEGNICHETGPLPSCFDIPLRVVLHILERDFLPGYLSSNLHIKYLSELINTVKTSVELLGRKKRSGSESTCSSEQSSSYGGAGISTHNTLLAMDTSAPHRFRNLDDPTLAMRIDETQITDPDSLWRRKNFSKMSCGYINELGRFESDLQPDPDRKTESKFSKTLKKFVNMDEDKVKEDMAYKVAEMIIKDVTSVTLRSQHSSRSSVESSVPPLSPSSISQDNFSDVFPS